MTMRVQAYKNLHRGDWSIRANGRVIDHRRECVLANATMKVSEASRQTVIRKRVRSVHAWIEGELVSTAPYGEWVAITYRPYDAPTFTRRDNGQPVLTARFVHLTDSNGAYALLTTE